MAHKTLIGGTAYEISNGKTLIDGTSYEVSAGNTLVGGTAHQIVFSKYRSIFAQNSWEAIIQACRNNEVPDTWKIGDQKTMTIGGLDYTIDIIGKNHDNYYDGSGKAPLTFQLHNLFKDSCRMNISLTNVGGWENSEMRRTYLPSILQQMPTDVKNAIKLVNKQSSAGNSSSNIVTTSDSLFLPSEVEVFAKNDYSYSGEGSQYAYYSEGNSPKKVYYNSGTSEKRHWWTRSAKKSSPSAFVMVAMAGIVSISSANKSHGVAPCFCF